MSSPAVILVTGRDPQRYVDDSHCGYVHAHGYAATRAGHDVHILCLDKSNRTELTAYGTLHAIKTHVHMVRQNQIPFHSSRLTLTLAALVRKLGSRATIIHGFGLWGHPAVQASKRLNSAGIRCISMIGSYTTYLDESQSQWRGLVSAAGIRLYATYAFEQAWIRTVLNHYEKFSYRNADRILVNYRSVERLIRNRFGEDLRCELVPYTVEKEFKPTQSIASNALLSRDATPVILCIARQQPRKGIDVLLRALQIVKAS